MKTTAPVLLVLTLALSTATSAQLWHQETPSPSFPPDIAAPSSSPDVQKASKPLTAEEAKSAIEEKLRSEPGLPDENINVMFRSTQLFSLAPCSA